MTTVYLAGPVAAVRDGGAGWRNAVTEAYGDDFEFANPLDKYNVPLDGLEIVPGNSPDDDEETVGVNEIVRGDKQLIRESDALLVGYLSVQSIGTPMEVFFAARRLNLPVALWIRDGTPIEDMSPWYRYHVDKMTHSVAMALDFVEGET
jgi:hypothetical protein